MQRAQQDGSEAQPCMHTLTKPSDFYKQHRRDSDLTVTLAV
jgi:hypothetical protein